MAPNNWGATRGKNEYIKSNEDEPISGAQGIVARFGLTGFTIADTQARLEEDGDRQQPPTDDRDAQIVNQAGQISDQPIQTNDQPIQEPEHEGHHQSDSTPCTRL